MKRGELFALDLETLEPEVDEALHGKYAIVMCVKRAAKRDCLHGKPYAVYTLCAPLFDKLPTLAQVGEVALLPMTHWKSKTPHAVYFMPDAPLPAGVTAIGKLKKPPDPELYRAYGTWADLAMIRSHQFVHDRAKK